MKKNLFDLLKSFPENSSFQKKLNRKHKPSNALYLTIFSSWGLSLLWFHPRLFSLMDMAKTPFEGAALLFFIVFIEVAWLYGFYNLGVVLFALIHNWMTRNETPPDPIPPEHLPSAAILYTTCNDFVEESVSSCVRQDYPNYKVYILDDSNLPEYQRKIDAFAAQHQALVKVIRRTDRQGYKAGNMNNALRTIVNEPYFAIADADEILPPDFLLKTIPYLENDPQIGFVQANHRANPKSASSLSKALGMGIDTHWKWYQPLRNSFGFVMFLGHGAVLRREAWEAIGGFPEIVSEDLGFAIRIRELGWRGYFAREVVCYEDFPETVRAFRIRHMKWTRGTCEFLHKEFKRLILARNISWSEKFDILFPTLNLPLTLFYFIFMINANLILPWLFGIARPLTLAIGGQDIVLPTVGFSEGFTAVYSADFFAITLLSFIAPVLCFILDMWRSPLVLYRFLCHSTLVYASLGPLSAVGVIAYFFTGKATFLVTGDRERPSIPLAGTILKRASLGDNFIRGLKSFFDKSHPDQLGVQAFEFFCGIIFIGICLMMFQVSFMGLAIAFVMMPFLHHLAWENRTIQRLSHVPFLLVLGGLALGGFAVMGMPTMFFSFGFHF